jgi:hypothetical protein
MRWAKEHPWVAAGFVSALVGLLVMLVAVPWEGDFPDLRTRLLLAAAS